MIKNERIVKLTPFLVFALITLIVFWNFIFYGETFYQVDFYDHLKPFVKYNPNAPRLQNVRYSDIFDYVYAHDVIYNSSIKEGRLPLWNPYSFCGTTFFADAQVNMLYPPKMILHWLFDVHTAYAIFLMLHFFFAPVCMYLLLRKLNLSMLPSTFGGIVWMLCSCMTVRFKYAFSPVTGVYWPLMVLFLLLGVQNRKINYFVVAGLLIGLYSFCCHPYFLMLFFYLFSIAFYLYCAVDFTLKNKKIPFQLTWHFAVMLLIALGISAVQFIPFWEAFLNSNRSLLTHEPPNPGRLPFMLLTLIFPRVFGSPIDKADFTSIFVTHYIEYQVYIGFIPLIFILVLLKFGKLTTFTKFILIFAILSLAIATIYPVLAFFNFLIPFLSASPPTKISYVYSYCAIILSAVGMQVFIEYRHLICDFVKKIAKLIFVLGIIGAVFCTILILPAESFKIHTVSSMARWLNIKNSHIYTPIIVMLISSIALFLYSSRFFKVFSYLIIIVILADLLPPFVAYNQTFPKPKLEPLSKVVYFLKRDKELFRIANSNVTIDYWGLEILNFLMPYKIQNAEGYEAQLSKDYATFTIHRNGKIFNNCAIIENLTSTTANLTNLKYVLSDKELTLPKDWYELVYNEDIYIYKNLKFIPRAFFVTQYKVCNQGEIFKQLKKAGFDPMKEVLIEETPPFKSSISNIPYQITFSHYSEDEVNLKTDTSEDGMLVLLDGYWPGWKCYVDGEKTEIYRAYGTFRAIKLNKGEHNVTFLYKPLSFTIGLWITIAAMLSAILFITSYTLNKQKEEISYQGK